ncbi:MAG TPA: dihydroorotase [Spirochaetes bacterium]|nr:dihydroorotase [Spirochaetota bacterium]
MSRKLLIKGGIVVCPAQNIEEKLDILIEGERIIGLKKDIRDKEAKTLDVKGKLVTPGWIDMHCHLREPGREDIGTIESGSKSAAAGGYTSIACMPNTDPVVDNQMGIEYILSRAKAVGFIHLLPIGALTKGLNGEELTEISTLVEAGAVALSDDENSIMDSYLMRRALEYMTMFDIPIIAHCEDRNLSEEGCVNEGLVSTMMGFRGIPSIAEEIMVSRDIILTEFTQSRLHMAHVSTKASVELIRKAKAEGVRVTSEVTPHHFTLTDTDILESNYNTHFKVSPPLRSKEDQHAVIEGLKDGTIDTIATDHNPWLDMEKDVEFIHAPFGIISIETALPLIFTRLITPKHLTLMEAIAKVTCNPAGILNLSKGTLSKGSVADITVIDPHMELSITQDFFHSISKNSPFIGQTMKGFAVYTLVEGEIVFDRHENTFYKRH